MLHARLRAAAGSGAGWMPQDEFSAGQPGVLFEFKPEYLFQDALGAVPVTAAGQQVKLILEGSRGRTKGTELVTNGTFDTDLSGWTYNAPVDFTWNSGAADIVRDSGSVNDFPRQSGLVSGKWYELSIDVLALSHTVSFYAGSTSSEFMISSTGTGQKRLIKATGSDFFVGPTSSLTATCTIDNVSVREVPGNHAVQTLSATGLTYQTDGTYHWLELNGFNGEMRFTGFDYLTSGFYFAAAIRRGSDVTGKNPTVLSSMTGSISGLWWAISRPGLGSLHQVRGDSDYPSDTAIAENIDHAIGARRSATEIFYRLDGASDGSVLSTSFDDKSGDDFCIGRIPANDDNDFVGRIYGIFMVGDSSANTAEIDNYLAGLMP